jgi:hypothetical protein
MRSPPNQGVPPLAQAILDAGIDPRLIPVLESNPVFARFIQKKNSAFTMVSYARWMVKVLGDRPDAFLERARTDAPWAERYLSDFILGEKGRVSEKTGRRVTALTILNCLEPVRRFCETNKVHLEWEELRSQLPKPRRVARDRPPSLAELRKFMEIAHPRERFVMPAIVSSGGRVGLFHHPQALGGWGFMELQHVTLVPIEGGKELSCLDWLASQHEEGSMIARLTVYPSEVEEYPAFWSVEAVDNLRTYMGLRERVGERFGPDTPVLRDAWNPHYHPEVATPMRVKGIQDANDRTWALTGVKKAAVEGGFKGSHGGRKVFETEGNRMVGALIPDEGMENHVTLEDIEIMKGKRTNYNKPLLYLQKVFLVIMPRLLIDAKYEERFKRLREREQFERFRNEDVRDLRLENLQLDKKARQQDDQISKLEAEQERVKRILELVAQGKVQIVPPPADA